MAAESVGRGKAAADSQCGVRIEGVRCRGWHFVILFVEEEESA